MNEASVAIPVPRPVAPEDQARADTYRLIARLFQAAPDAELLAAIAALQPEAATSDFSRALEKLALAARAMDVEAAATEFSELFEAAGKPEVICNASYYLAGFMHERPLARLREDLNQLGLARNPDGAATEDHVSAVCEVMHYLITRLDRPESGRLDAQRTFFAAHVGPWMKPFCAEIQAAQGANFYRVVAAFVAAFIEVEREQFTFT